MSTQPSNAGQRKKWDAPKLEQLTVDLSAIAQKQKGSTDLAMVGAVS